MGSRNLSPQTMFEELAREHIPTFHFANWPAGHSEWKTQAWPQVKQTLGDFPERVPINPLLLAEWEQDGLRKQRWVIDVGRHISAILIVNIPSGLKSGETRPTILCWHGHGLHGKDAVMGNDSSAALRESIASANYDYGRQMAQAGFVTYAIDWIGMGERNDSLKPHFKTHNGGRDWCNLYYLHATMLGMTSISINVAHGMAATDFIVDLPFVDSNRHGVMGLSGGGTMALWSALCDERFKATEIICYSDLWANFGIRDLNYCGMQVAPGLFKLVDLPDLQGLLAPRPLLIDIGIYDTCFVLDSALACYHQLEAIYREAGATDRLSLDLSPSEHSWGGHQSMAFFTRYLSA
ncbi:MAG TPA: alpha/beta hydrolase family protein [Anaerolineae bacterium]